MVHWLDDAMPLQSGGDECSVVMRRNRAGQWGAGTTACRSWRPDGGFEEGVEVLRWCADHADVLMRRDRCLAVRPLQLAGRRYTTDVEDSPPTGHG